MGDDKKIDETLQKNQSPKSQAPKTKANPDSIKEFGNEEKLHTTKLEEDCQDAQHSLNNGKKLNNIYSQLINIFFGGWWFYIWVFILFILFVVNDNDFMKFEAFKEYVNETIVFIAKKLFYALGALFIALLSFPTAKGIRRLFRSIIDIFKHKVKNL